MILNNEGFNRTKRVSNEWRVLSSATFWEMYKLLKLKMQLKGMQKEKRGEIKPCCTGSCSYLMWSESNQGTAVSSKARGSQLYQQAILSCPRLLQAPWPMPMTILNWIGWYYLGVLDWLFGAICKLWPPLGWQSLVLDVQMTNQCSQVDIQEKIVLMRCIGR